MYVTMSACTESTVHCRAGPGEVQGVQEVQGRSRGSRGGPGGPGDPGEVQGVQGRSKGGPGGPIIEPHGRVVPEATLNDRSPRTGRPSCGLRPHSGRPVRGERSLSMAEGTPRREVLFLLYPFRT